MVKVNMDRKFPYHEQAEIGNLGQAETQDGRINIRHFEESIVAQISEGISTRSMGIFLTIRS